MRYLLAAVLAAAAAVPACAQVTVGVSLDVKQIALVTVKGTVTGLTLVAPADAGAAVAAAENSATRLQYTSTVASGTRTISASISTTPPAGTKLAVEVTPSGTGTCGSSSGLVTLTTTAAPVVTGVGACYTGAGATDGATLHYILSADNYGLLKSAAASSITVTYTIGSTP